MTVLAKFFVFVPADDRVVRRRPCLQQRDALSVDLSLTLHQAQHLKL
jgi:hypothetical protein